MRFYAALAILSLPNKATATDPDPNCGSLVGCSLVNLNISGPRQLPPSPQAVTELFGGSIEYNPEDGDRDGWSIQCETTGTINYVKYDLGGGDVKTHYSAPFWVNGDNSGTYINKLDSLSECGSEETTIGVTFHSWEGGDPFPCGSTTLTLIPDCGDVSSGVKVSTPAPCPNFQCPLNSKPSSGVSCISDFGDCECSSGYEKKNGECVEECPKFQCPANSSPSKGVSCIRGLGDCECSSGYEKKNGTCVEKCPNFQCPPNSNPSYSLSCVSGFGDCQCSSGYERANGECVEKCPNFQCPANSSPSQGVSCIRGVGDCECTIGYEKKDSGECVEKCPNFQCPANSAPSRGVSCIRGLGDCECSSGYEKKNGACVQKCPNFQCPANSSPSYRLSCISGFGDCQCSSGYEKMNGACVEKCPNFQCPANSSRKAGLTCTRNILDCECRSDYELQNGACVTVERPPQPGTCYLWTGKYIFYGYNADIPRGAVVEAETSSGQRFSYSTTGSSSSTVPTPDYRLYGKSDFKIRFVFQNGVAGEWKGCTNYFGTSTMMPVTGRCYMWSNKLFFGKSTYVSRGYTVEARTVVGKYFRYSATGQNYVKADDFRSYDSQPFHLRFVDRYGKPGPWRTCVNYTPIAVDVDQSGAVEHITGEFVIDITANGEPETLEEWFAPTEGILIDTMLGTEHSINKIGGAITGHHLFGDMGRTYVDGYEKLALLDADDDGFVSGQELDGLAIWIDVNSNALLDDGELSSLESHNIVSLGVVHDNFISEAILSDGSTMMTEDKWFVR